MQLTDWYRLFTWLTLAVNVSLVLLWGWRTATAVSDRARPRWDAVRDVLGAQGLALAALVAVVATLGSLYLSEGAHLVPCRLCWFQRTMMYPLAVLLVIAAFRRDWHIRPYALVLCVLGFAFSTWHYLVEWFPDLEGVGGSCDPTNPCSALPLPRRYGYVSIPFMAGSAFLFVASVLWLAGRPRSEESV
jgi:disulfide bond formation protein DsbB